MIRFRCYGKPAPKGSYKSFVQGRRAITVDASATTRPWMLVVADEARRAWGDRSPMEGPLVVHAQFFFERPKSHYRANGNLKESAPKFPIPARRWDIDKLLRCVYDAMEEILYFDDAQIVDEIASKRWAGAGVRHGVAVVVMTAEEAER